MAVTTLVICALELGAGVGEFAKLFEESPRVHPRSQHHGNVDVACGKLEAVAMGTKRAAAEDFEGGAKLAKDGYYEES